MADDGRTLEVHYCGDGVIDKQVQTSCTDSTMLEQHKCVCREQQNIDIWEKVYVRYLIKRLTTKAVVVQ